MVEDARDRLRSLLSSLSAEQRTALLRRLRPRPDAPTHPVPSAAPDERQGDVWGLSHGQHRVWLLEQLCPRQGLTVEVEVFHVDGPLDHGRFDDALASVIDRHDALRSGFVMRHGRLRRELVDGLPLPLDHVDLSALPEDDQRERVLAWQLGDEARGFDLATPPLFRSCLFRLGATRHVWCVAAHHIICDGWSIRVLLADLGRALRSKGAWPGPHVGRRYAEFVAWERARLEGEPGRALRDYWTRTLADAPDGVALPLDRPRPPRRRFAGRRVDHPMPPALRDRCEALGRTAGASGFMVGLAGFHALLWSLTGQRDLVIATPVANREHPEMHEVIGCFVNTVPVRVRLHEELGFLALLDQVRGSVLGALDHQGLPFDEIVRARGVSPATDRPVLCNVMFVYEETLAPVLAGEVSLRLGQQRADRGRSMFDLLLWVSARSHGWTVTAEHDDDLLERSTVRDLLERYEHTMATVVEHPDRPLLEYLRPAAATTGDRLAHEDRFSFERTGASR